MSSPRVWFSKHPPLHPIKISTHRAFCLAVTGASTGFGRALTELVLAQGEIAIATARRPEVFSELTRHYALALKLDVTEPQDITAAFAQAQTVFGRIDVVVGNAAWAVMGEVEVHDLSTGAPVHAMFEANVWGARPR